LSLSIENGGINQTLAPRATRRTGGASNARRAVWRSAIAAGVLALAYLPVTGGVLKDGWSGPHYRYVPIVLLCAGVLMTRAWRQLGPAEPATGWRGAVLPGTAWAVLLAAVLAGSPALGAVSALLLAIALLDARGGWPLLRRCVPALALLALSIPLPRGVVWRLSWVLQGLVARGAATVLDRLTVPNLRSGTILELADGQRLVDEAASGADGLLLVFAITLFLAVTARRSALSIVVLLASGLFWTVAVAVTRVAGVAYLAVRSGDSLSRGWPGAAPGLVGVAATLALVLSTDRLLWVLGAIGRRFRSFNPERIPPRAVAPPDIASDAPPGPRGLVSWRLTAAFGLLAMIQIPYIHAANASRADALRKLETLTADTLPAAWGTWQRQGFEAIQHPGGDRLGSESRVWRYQGSSVPATLIVRGPAPPTGVLAPYFQSLGWTVTEATRSGVGGLVGNFREYRLDKPLGRSAHLFVAQFDVRDQPLDVASGRRLDEPWPLLPRLAEPGGPSVGSHQVELLVEVPRPLTVDEVGQARVFFRFALHRLHGFARPQEEVRP
jgi:hypothetical protein